MLHVERTTCWRPKNAFVFPVKLCGPIRAWLPRLERYQTCLKPSTARSEFADNLRISKQSPILAICPTAVVSVLTDARIIYSRSNAAWEAGLKLRDSTNLPATQRPASETRLVAEKR